LTRSIGLTAFQESATTPAIILAVSLPVWSGIAGSSGEFHTRTVTIRTIAGIAVQADISLPEGDGLRPVVVWIHGGALIFGDRSMISPEQRELYLKEGFGVLSVDYRLAPETKLDEILEDLTAIPKWLAKEGRALGLDADRMAVVGHSAGGYLALMSGIRFLPRPKAIVSFYGYGDIDGEWYSRPDPFYLRTPRVSEEEAWAKVGSNPLTQGPEATRFDFYRFCRQQGLWPKLVTGFDPVTQPAQFDRFCPIRNVSPDFPATLLVHGEKDTDVPVEQSRKMAAALSAQGVEHRLRVLPGRDHVFDTEPKGLRDPATAAVFAEVIDFLRLHCR